MRNLEKSNIQNIEKSREIEHTRYTGKDQNRTSVRMITNKSLKEEVEVMRIGVRFFFLIKLVLGEETINIVSENAP